MTNDAKLSRNDIRRFEIEGRELTCGDPLEVLLSEQWIRGRIEYIHAWEDYALVLSAGLDFETLVMLHQGMPARLPVARSD